jgi:hypothetical protein
MIFEQKNVRKIYRALLGLYPRAFRERFGESMEQTFSDLCREHQRELHKIPLRIVVWMFIETSAGIATEYFIELKRGEKMKTFKRNFKWAAIAGFVSILPFVALESINRDGSTSFPFPLFGFLWLLFAVFTIVLLPMVQTVRTGGSLPTKPALLLIGGVFTFLIAVLWGGIVADQMPCFMGVPNCD